MTKQEEIKEGIAIKLCNHDGFDWEWLKEQQRYKGQKDCEYYLRCADDILKYEDSQGVVIKTKCPDCVCIYFEEEVVGMTPCYSCNSTGYIIKPLIEEG